MKRLLAELKPWGKRYDRTLTVNKTGRSAAPVALAVNSDQRERQWGTSTSNRCNSFSIHAECSRHLVIEPKSYIPR